MPLIPDDPGDGCPRNTVPLCALESTTMNLENLRDPSRPRYKLECITNESSANPLFRPSFIVLYIFWSNKFQNSREITRGKIADRWFRESFLAAQILPSIVWRTRVQHLYYTTNNGVLYGDSIYIGFFAVCYTYHGAPCVATACVEVSCKIDPPGPFAKQVYHCRHVRKILYMERIPVVRSLWNSGIYRFILDDWTASKRIYLDVSYSVAIVWILAFIVSCFWWVNSIEMNLSSMSYNISIDSLKPTAVNSSSLW